jgi:endonuclease/exonuclease/phosphatase family metal-dependent hydrolase
MKFTKWIALLLIIVLLSGCASKGEDFGTVAGAAGSVQQGQNTQGEQTPGGTEQTPGGTEQTPGSTEQTPDGDQTKPNNSVAGSDPYAAMKADQSGTKVKILCQNLRYDASDDQITENAARLRRGRFKQLMDKYDPDILAAQECCSTWINYLQEDYGSKYEMFYQYRGNTTGSNESCPVLWKKDKYEKIKTGYFWLSDTPKVVSSSFIEGSYPRIVNWVELKDKSTGQKFRIYSTHFGLNYTTEHTDKIRRIFANEFAGLPKDTYAFVMGDFNITYGENQYLHLVDEINLTDLRPISEAMAGNGHCTLGEIRNGAYNAFSKPDGSVFGDFIMALPRKQLAVDFFGYCYEQFGGYVSDHFAVYTEVRLGTKVSYAEYYSDSAK